MNKLTPKGDEHYYGIITMIQFSDNIIGAIKFTIAWEKDGHRHEEIFIGRKINPVNDIFPVGMREALEGKHAGESVTLTYEPRRCIPRFKESQVLTLPLDRLRKKTVLGGDIRPSVGRFYPQGHINGLRDIYPDTLTPFRLIGLTKDTFTADRNHPLANIPITITAKIEYLEERDTGTYGSLAHWRESTCDWGPGMQAMHDGTPTQFDCPGFFSQLEWKAPPFTPPIMDAKARENIDATFARFLNPDMRVLDASISSMETMSGQYDAAIMVQTMEHMDSPAATLRALHIHLKPGAPVLIGFTNHYHPAHVIHGWTEMHEFERMGYVLEYMRQAELDHNAGTISIRNDWRDKDDPRFMETRGVSDPIYVVYGFKE